MNTLPTQPCGSVPPPTTGPFRLRGLLLQASAVLLLAATVGCGGKSEADLIASSEQFLAAKDTRAAIIQLKSALQQNPNSPKARLLIGQALLESGDPALALVELRKAHELMASDADVVPVMARAMLLVGEGSKLISEYGQQTLDNPKAQADLLTSLAAAHAAAGDTAQATTLVNQALGLDPGMATATVLKARLLAADRDLDAALALLDGLLAREPGHQAAGTFKGDLFWRGRNDTEQALQAYAKVLADHPTAVGAHSATINILRAQNKAEAARTQFDLLKKAAPQHPETLFLEAQFAFGAQDYKGAVEIANRLLKVAPDHVQVLELAGAAEYRLKNYLQAEAHFGRALKNAPGLLLSRQLLAQTYLRTGQPQKVIEVLQPMLDAKEPDGSSLALAAEAWLQMGDAQKSEAAFQRAAKAAPGDNRVRTAAALAQLARGNTGSAISELESVASEDKGPRADLALVSARLRQNDTAGALKALDGLQAKMPDSPMPYNLRGRVQLLGRDLAGAKGNFEAALGKDPTYFPAIASLAALDLSAGKPEAARKRFEDLLKVQPNNHQALLSLAELAVRTGGTPTAVLGYMREAVKLNPLEPTPHLLLVRHLLSSGDANAALVAAQQATSQLPGNLELLDMLGRAQLATRDANQALSTYNRLVGLQPTNALHQVRLAEAYVAKDDLAMANKSLDKALQMQPGLRAAQRAKVALAVQDRRHADALALVHGMQKESPKDGALWVMEGEIEAHRKNWDGALSAYRGALQRQKVPDHAVKLHSALLRAGKQDEAARFAATWNRDRPQDPVFLYHLGDVALASADLPAAERHYRAVLEVQPRNALALNNVAWLLAKQGKPGAVEMAEQANRLMPERAQLLDTLATALAADKQTAKAIETQKRALTLSPQDPGLKLNLARHYLQNGEKPQARAELEDLARLGDRFAGQGEVAALLKSL